MSKQPIFALQITPKSPFSGGVNRQEAHIRYNPKTRKPLRADAQQGFPEKSAYQ